MKRAVSVLLILLMMALCLPVGVSADTVAQENYLTYELVDGTYTVTTCVKSISGDLVIPAEYKGKPVTAIRRTAFFECIQLASVTIPDTVTSIGDQAFGSCTHLSKVVIPNSVTSIGFDAFHNTAIYNNTANWDGGLLYIDGCVVASQADLTEAILNVGTRLIAGDAFFGSAITAVSIPDSVTVVGARAFTGCDSLTDLYYGGKEAAWKAVSVAEGNTALNEAAKHYETLLDKPTPGEPAKKTKTVTTQQTKKTINKTWLWVSIGAGAVAVACAGLMVYNAIRSKKAKTAEATEATEDTTEKNDQEEQK